MTTRTFPSLTPTSTVWGFTANTKRHVSPFTQAVQYERRDGDRFRVTVEFSALSGANRATLSGFLVQVAALADNFTFTDHAFTLQGTGAGTPLVNGASQTGTSLITDGWDPSEVVLKAGDLFSVGGELKMVLSDVTSDTSGNATISLAPGIRTAPGDGAALDLSAPTGVFMLATDDVAWNNRPGVLSSFQFDIVEDVLA